jgi:ABC-type antimicrobial peptide transport system permease subunit
VNARVLRFARYRFRATFGRQWGGHLAVIGLVGLVGGLAMGSLAGARRTQSSFPSFLRSTNPSDLIVFHNDSANDDNSSDPAFLRTIAHLPHVKQVESATSPSLLVLGPDGGPAQDAASKRFDSAVRTPATIDGLFFDQDRMTVIHGRRADPRRPDEMVMTAGAARILGMHLGDVVHFGFYNNSDTLKDGYGTASVPPVRRVAVTLVGIVVANDAIVQDDVDRSTGDGALLSPALTGPLNQCCANNVTSGLRLDHGSRDVAAVESEIKQALPNSTVVALSSVAVATAQRSIEPLTIALGAFGAIAALAALLIAAQVIGRQLRLEAGELETVRALGASPAMTSSDGLIGIVGAVVVGSLLAGAVAVGLSPLAPLGRVRPVDPAPGIAFDWAVLGIGMLVLVVVMSSLAAALAYWGAPHRVARRRRRTAPNTSRVARAAGASGLPAPVVAGVRFAVEPGAGTNAAPVRSAILGAVLAVVVMVATITFGDSLHTLVSRPALYGWNWDYELLSPYSGFADIPLPEATRLLDQDVDVAAWAGVSFDTFRIDGQTVPVMGVGPSARVGPPVLTGHALIARDQVVLGATTLAALHKRVGDTVDVSNGVAPPTRLVIVGTATLPAIGSGSTLHLEIGTGAVLSDALIPPGDKGFGDLVDSPQAILLRLRHGTNAVASRHSLLQIAASLDVLGHGPPTVVSVQRPAEIVNYRTMGTTPTVLGAGLAAGAVVALALTLLASVRRRRRDLALLKTLGMTRRQLVAVVASQSTIAAATGIIVGVPLGIVVGRWSWTLFAHQVHVVPAPSVPASSIALIAAGALVLATIVSAVPGRIAARTPTALLLRAE